MVDRQPRRPCALKEESSLFPVWGMLSDSSGGVMGSGSTVGRPTLERIASRAYIAGHLINEPRTMTAWIRDPQHLRAPTGMPTMDTLK